MDVLSGLVVVVWVLECVFASVFEARFAFDVYTRGCAHLLSLRYISADSNNGK